MPCSKWSLGCFYLSLPPQWKAASLRSQNLSQPLPKSWPLEPTPHKGPSLTWLPDSPLFPSHLHAGGSPPGVPLYLGFALGAPTEAKPPSFSLPNCSSWTSKSPVLLVLSKSVQRLCFLFIRGDRHRSPLVEVGLKELPALLLEP